MGLVDGTSFEGEPDELGLDEALNDLAEVDPAEAAVVAHSIAERLARILDSTDPF
jgi:hypothetical protein